MSTISQNSSSRTLSSIEETDTNQKKSGKKKKKTYPPHAQTPWNILSGNTSLIDLSYFDVDLFLAKRTPFFHAILPGGTGALDDNDENDKRLKRLLSFFEWDRRPPGSILYEEDEEGKRFWIVLQGSVKLEQHGHLLRTLSVGEGFGEEALTGRRFRTFCATTTSYCTLLSLPRERYPMLVEEMPMVGSEMQRLLRREIVDALRDVPWLKKINVKSDDDDDDDDRGLLVKSGGEKKQDDNDDDVENSKEMMWSRSAVSARAHSSSLVRNWHGKHIGKLDWLASLFEITQLVEGEVLFKEGDPGDSFYVIQSGRVQVSGNGGRWRTELARKDHFGQVSLLYSCPRTATIVAIDRCKLLSIRREKWLRFLELAPELREDLQKQLAAHLSNSLSQIECFRSLDGCTGPVLQEFFEPFPCDAGKVLFKKGDPVTDRYCLITGCIMLDERFIINNNTWVTSSSELNGNNRQIHSSTAVVEIPSMCMRLPKAKAEAFFRAIPGSREALLQLRGIEVNARYNLATASMMKLPITPGVRHRISTKGKYNRFDWISQKNANGKVNSKFDMKRKAWEYKDPQGVVHGLFSTEKMRKWNQEGFLLPEVPVRYRRSASEVQLAAETEATRRISNGENPSIVKRLLGLEKGKKEDGDDTKQSFLTIVEVQLEIGSASPFGTINDGFAGTTLSFQTGANDPLWKDTSILTIDLDKPGFVEGFLALNSPLVRVGGGLEHKIVMEVNGNECAVESTPDYDCLKMPRWKEILAFATKAKIKLVWSLGAQKRLNSTSPLDFSNIDAFLKYTSTLGSSVLAGNQGGLLGFELGNELDGGDYKSGVSVPPNVLAHDYETLRSLIDKYWPSKSKIKPVLVGPAMHLNAQWAAQFLGTFSKNSQMPIDIFSFHDYVGYGPDPLLARKVMDVNFLNAYIEQALPTISVVRSLAPETDIIVGETSAAWASGQCGVTDKFNGSFWFANSLGAMARNGVKAFARHSYNGGCYKMVDCETMKPNPDWYVAQLFSELVGRNVLDLRKLTVTETKVTSLRRGDIVLAGNEESTDLDKLLVYAFTSRRYPGGVGAGATLLLINVSESITYQVNLSDYKGLMTPRNEFHLTSESLSSSDVLLNGNLLQGIPSKETLLSFGISLKDVEKKPIQVTPYSITFVELPNARIY
eukprot:g2940.t1